MIVFVTNLMQYAVNGYSVNAYDFIVKPFNYYSFAIKLKNIEIVQELIKSKAFVNLPNKDTQTPLFLAVKIHWLKIIKLLLKNGANPNLWLTNKQSVLDISSQDVEEILIHYGAKENTRHLIK